jgi:D-beta-D-heptose 7-phosphate kinase/D-beta-D-heptose 1-phosphate adenosyltransferase
LGAQSYFIGVAGQDRDGWHLDDLLSGCNATYKLFKRSDFQTIRKTRIITNNHHVARVDYEIPLPPVDPKYLGTLEKLVFKYINQCDIVLISDYGKGLLTTETTSLIIYKGCAHFQKACHHRPKGHGLFQIRIRGFRKAELERI